MSNYPKLTEMGVQHPEEIEKLQLALPNCEISYWPVKD